MTDFGVEGGRSEVVEWTGHLVLVLTHPISSNTLLMAVIELLLWISVRCTHISGCERRTLCSQCSLSCLPGTATKEVPAPEPRWPALLLTAYFSLSCYIHLLILVKSYSKVWSLHAFYLRHDSISNLNPNNLGNQPVWLTFWKHPLCNKMTQTLQINILMSTQCLQGAQQRSWPKASQQKFHWLPWR